MEQKIKEVALGKAYRLLNVGGTTLVSAKFNGQEDIMPATWAIPMDTKPFRAGVVIDSAHFTRRLIDGSALFSLQIPTVKILKETMILGTFEQK